MKKLLVCLLMSQLAMPLQAQPDDGQPPRHKGLHSLIQILQIDASQSEAFLTIMKAQHEQRKQLQSQYKGSRIEERQGMKALHKQMLEQLQGVLTESQIEAFEAITAQRHRMRQHRPHQPNPPEVEE